MIKRVSALLRGGKLLALLVPVLASRGTLSAAAIAMKKATAIKMTSITLVAAVKVHRIKAITDTLREMLPLLA
ncbi:hypothetical protein SJI19_07650 [Acerihabitans sp. TG2]|uniref:hypothetical protein n=1 Tax=Acerihabitans sp. TG2 TaxID=3096008 RepID=UPI002B232710|nr:hypothetical protein [Acerihabitans sp. TG2]MEA9390417.1 hypothetical protein [Acerihabitans sp. TG2]